MTPKTILRTLAFLVAAIMLLGTWVFFRAQTRPDGPTYVVQLEQAPGLREGAPVRYRGLEVGRIERVTLGPDQRAVQARIRVDGKLNLRKDATLLLATEGLFGESLLEIAELGHAEEELSEGDVLKATEPATVDAETLLRAMNNLGNADRLSEIEQRLQGVEQKLDRLLLEIERLKSGTP